MISSLLSLAFLITPVSAQEFTSSELEELGESISQTTEAPSEIERFLEDFNVNCNSFYGCGVGYSGVDW